MKALETTGTVTNDRKLITNVPPDVEPGEHSIVVLIDESTNTQRRQTVVDIPSYPNRLVDPTGTFRREDIYDADGR